MEFPYDPVGEIQGIPIGTTGRVSIETSEWIQIFIPGEIFIESSGGLLIRIPSRILNSWRNSSVNFSRSSKKKSRSISRGKLWRES